jgi:hypothetical protein
MAFIGDENAQLALPPNQTGSTAMLHRRPFKQLSTLEDRLAEEAINLRKQAEGMPLSIRRDELMRKGRPDGSCRSHEWWLTSPGLCAPR